MTMNEGRKKRTGINRDSKDHVGRLWHAHDEEKRGRLLKNFKKQATTTTTTISNNNHAMAPLPRNEVDESSHLLEDTRTRHHALQNCDDEAAEDVEEGGRKHHSSESPRNVVEVDAMLPMLSFYCYQDNNDFGNLNQLQQRSCLSRSWTAYANKLERRPLLVKSLTAFVLLGLADACAQACQHFLVPDAAGASSDAATDDQYSVGKSHLDHWDWVRSLRFGVFGLVGAPWSHYYFDWLDALLPPTPDRPCSWVTFAKLFIDQFLQAPLLLGVIMVVIRAMEAQGFSSIVEDLHHHYWGTLIANCKLNDAVVLFYDQSILFGSCIPGV